MVIKKSLFTWWLQHSKLQVMFKVSPASLQTFIDTRLTLTPSVIHNSNYVIMVSDWNCLKYFCMFFLYCNHQVHRDFWSPCTSVWYRVIPMAARCKAKLYCRLLAGIADSNLEFESRRGHGCLFLNVVCCQVEVSVSGWSLVQRSPIVIGVSERDCEASIMRRTWPTGGCCTM
jgi:hypothetical protein